MRLFNKEPLAEELRDALLSSGIIEETFGVLFTTPYRKFINAPYRKFFNEDRRIPNRLEHVENMLAQVINLLAEAGIVHGVACECGSGKITLKLKQKENSNDKPITTSRRRRQANPRRSQTDNSGNT